MLARSSDSANKDRSEFATGNFNNNLFFLRAKEDIISLNDGDNVREARSLVNPL
jgi:hypothetical protein